MNNTQKLTMTISDMILDVVDGGLDLPRGDLQGFSEAQAQNIIALVLAARETL